MGERNSLVNHLKSCIRNQCFRNADTFRSLCGGDMSFTAALCFDFEVYSEAQKRWLEVSSVSNFDTYQANRLKCRYRTAEKKTELCHTLNGSALALPRIVAALLENNQTQDAIRQFQFLEQSFHVVQHLLMRLFGMFRLVDAHQFYFGEFVQTVQAAHVFTV